MQSPLVSRKNYEQLVEWKRQATEVLAMWDKVQEFVWSSPSAKLGAYVQDEALRLLTEGAEATARIAELESQEAEIQRGIAEVEGRIKIAELEAQLRKIKEQESQPEENRRRRPTKEEVLKVAAVEREKKTAKK